MKVLVINCGSSSVKYQLMETDDGSVLARGQVERIGLDDAVFTYIPAGGEKTTRTLPVDNHTVAVREVLASLTGGNGILESLEDIGAVGHRFVHGGDIFSESVLVDEKVLEQIRDILDLAPLHNPANLLGIEAAMDVMPATPQVVVFDTAFHAHLEPRAYMYALPYEYYEKYAVRKYGFHGTSHYYVSRRAAELSGKPDGDLNIITCHLGNGCSMDAVKNGRAIDTTMGFTPLEGLMMGTRCGDLDPAAVLHIMKRENLTPDEMDTILNKKSGLAGFTGISSDMRDIETACNEGDERAGMAVEMYAYRIKKYIGAYTAALGGLDVLVFTAGVGENSPLIRARAVEGLEYLDIELDPEKNDDPGRGESVISTGTSRVMVAVIPTNEEIVIAREAARLSDGR